MTWRDRYLSGASYAGVPFLIESHEFTTGRTAAVHVYPQRDTPTVEDTGRAVRRFRVRGFLLGDDYDLDRDRLIAACETRSPGYPFRVGRALIHPYLGTLTVFCESLRVSERITIGRTCTLDFDFVETSETVLPVREASNDAATDEAAAELSDAAAENAEGSITTSGVPEEVRNSTAAATADLGKALSRLDVFSGPTVEVAVAADEIRSLINDAKALAVAPATLVATIRSAIESIFTTASGLRGALDAYRSLWLFTADQAVGGSRNAHLARQNALAVQNLARELALAGAARAAVRIAWTYLGEAVAAREELLAQVDRLLLESGDRVLGIVPGILQALAEGIPSPDESLPRIREIVLTDWEPALLTAWRLYGDRTRAEEISTRNRLPRAGFVPAAVPLEVLTDA